MKEIGTHPVLIVEDDPSTCELECLVLNRGGIEVATADSGAAAIALLQRKQFSAVLLDYRLPDGICWHVLEAAKNCANHIPTIVVTAMGDERVAIEAIHRGAADYVVKNGSYWEHLPDIIRRAIKRFDIERELEESRTRLQAAIHASGIGLWDWNIKTNAVVYSREWKSQLGYDENELSDTFSEWETRLHPEEKKSTLKFLAEYLKTPKPMYEHEFRLRHKDGSYRWFLCRASVQPGKDGRPVRMLGANMDITGRRRAESEIATRARQQAAVAELGQLALSGASISQIRDKAVALIAETFGVEFCQVLELLPDRSALKVIAGIGWKTGIVGNDKVGIGHDSQAGFTLLSTGPVVVEDLKTETRFKVSPLLRDHNIVSGISVMLPSEKGPWGVLSAHTTQRRSFSQDDIYFFQSMANVISEATHRTRAHEALKDRETLLANAQRVAGLGLWDLDLQRNYLNWSEETHRIFGVPPDKFERNFESFFKLLQPEDAEHIKSTYLAPPIDKPIVEAEYRIKRPDGEERVIYDRGEVFFNAAGRPVRKVGVVMDITVLKQTEKALRESGNEFRTLAEAMPQIVWISGTDGRHVYFNQRWLDYTGLTLEESYGHGWILPFHADDKQRAWKAWQHAIKTGETFSLECSLCRKDGTFRAWLIRGVPLRDGNGNIMKWFGTCTDIDDLKQAEERLRQSQKMEAIGHLAGGIAHDFNNLLTVIIGHSQLIMSKLKPDDQMNKQIGLILKTGERAANLTRQLLAFSRQQMLQPTIVDFNVVVSEIKTMLRRLVREDIDITVSLEKSLWTVSADRGQLEQVIVNLVVNARDAMPNGGKIIIETKNVKLDQTFTRTRPYVQPGSYVMFSVTDTGCGMDPAVKARIFEPFFTTKEPGKGTGLGLSTVYGIVKQSGGYIELYSEVNAGTTFKIYLPMVAGLSSASLPAVQRNLPVHGYETILLVEDDEDVRDLIRDVLSSYGYKIILAKHGKEALQIAADKSRKIDLLVSDIVMPELGGPELAKQLFEIRPEIRRLFMSGYTDQAVFQTTLLEQGAAFIQKPFTSNNLVQKVREILDNGPQP